MLTSTAGKHLEPTETQLLSRDAANIASRRIWLPRLVYDVLPYFYIASGFAALFATLYISAWFWVLPHYLLFSAACIHLGIVIQRRRRRASDSGVRG